jgi:hypothetical protein
MMSNETSKKNEAWYAQYPMLNRALTLLKLLPDYVQELVGKQLYTYAKELAFEEYEALFTDEDSSSLGLKRLKQFRQNKAHHSLVSRALNEVMGLNEQGRSLVGQRLLLCLQALDNLARQHTGGGDFTSTAQSRIEAHTLIKLVFDKSLSDFELQGQQRKAERQQLLAEEKLAEAILSKALEEVGEMVEMESHYPATNEDIQDEVLQRVELDSEMARMAALQEAVPNTLIPTVKRIGRFLVLFLSTPEEAVIEAVESSEESTQDSIVENAFSDDIFASSSDLGNEIVHTKETLPQESEVLMKKSVSFEPSPEKAPKNNREVLGPFELSEAERHALIDDVIHPFQTDLADQKVNNILSLIDSGVNVDTIPPDATPEEKLARGLALFNNSDPPLIQPNKRDLALTATEIDALIARVSEAPEVRIAKEQAKQKVLDALDFMNDLVKPSIGADATSSEETLAKVEETLKKPRAKSTSKSNATDKKVKTSKEAILAKGLSKSTAEAKPKLTSKNTSKTTTTRKKATDVPKE